MGRNLNKIILFILLSISFPIIGQSQSNKELIDNAIDEFKRGNTEQAFAIFSQAIQQEPSSSEARYKMSIAHFKHGDIEAAIDTAMTILPYEDDYFDQAVNLIGNSLDKLGKTDESIDFFHRTIEDYGGNYLRYYNLAYNYFKLDSLDKAKQYASESVLLNQSYPAAHLLLAETMYKKEDRIPTLLSYSHYFMLAPDAKNYPQLFDKFKETFFGKDNFHTDNETNTISVAVGENKNSNYRLDELNVNISIGMAAADKRFNKAFSGQEAEPIDERHPGWNKYNNGIRITQFGLALELFFITLKETPPTDVESDIWRELYIPFYQDMEEKKLLRLHSKIIEVNSLDIKKKQKFYFDHSRQIEGYREWIKDNLD